MKTNKVILTIGFLFLVVTMGNAQDQKSPEIAVDIQNGPTTIMKVIGENDYSYFLNMTSLKRYSNIKYNILVANPSDLKRYTLTGQGRNIKLNATYGKAGKLIQGRLITKNSPLPKVINMYLFTHYKDWTMKSNKTFVNDFDARKTEYEVKIKKNKKKQTLFFDHSGKRIKKLFRHKKVI